MLENLLSQNVYVCQNLNILNNLIDDVGVPLNESSINNVKKEEHILEKIAEFLQTTFEKNTK